MVHLTNTSRSAIFLLGTAMLMLFFFCAPMHAQTPTFKSTSSYRITNPNYSAQQLDPTTIGHYTYRSTIYTPFGSSTPSSNNNPGGNNDSGSGTDDDDDNVGIGGWMDTPSEPLPIGDGIGILLLMATMMVGAIFLKQRKQLSESISKSTTSTTNINNLRGNQLPTALKKENNTTQHMTTRKQTYQSFFQKLFLLLVFVCIAGQVSAEKKTIYFRPSTVGIDNGYAGSWGLTSATTAHNVSWAKLKSDARFLVLEKKSDGTYAEYWEYKLAANILPTATDKTALYSRFIPTELESTSSFAIYRIQKGHSTLAWDQGQTKEHKYNCIPNNEWWNGQSDPKSIEGRANMLFSMSDLGDCNMVAIREGYWATGRNDNWKGYYFGYYLEEDAHIYFDNKNDWTAPTFLRGKDIYAYSHNLTQISGTDLWYCKLAKPTADDVESGIAYTQYAFISQATTKEENTKTFTKIALGTEDPYLWKRWPHNSDDDSDLSYSEKDNNSFDKLRQKTGYSYTAAVTGDKLSGETNLYIPGAANNATVQKHTLNGGWQDLNHEQTIKVEGVGNFNYYAFKLTSATTTNDIGESNKTGTVTFDAAYTSTVILRAYDNVSGYKFIGWFEEGSNTPIVADASMLYEQTQEINGVDVRTVVYKYIAPNAPKTIVARYDAYVSKQFRIQSFKNNGDATIDNNDWLDWTITPSDYSVNIKYTDVTSGLEVSNTYNNKPSDNRWYNINYIKSGAPLVLTANENQTEYTFIGWWNSAKGQFADNPMTMENPEDYDKQITARFAIIKPQSISVQTYDTSKDTYMPSVAGGSVTITYHEGISSPTVSVEPTGTYKALCGSPVTLTATPSAGYSFVGWYEGQNLVSKDVTYTYNATEARNITAHFAEGTGTTTLQVRAMKWNGSQLVKSVEGGTFTITHSGGVVYAYQEQVSDYHHVLVANSPATFQATINDGYEFIGWFNSSKGPFLDNPWIMLDPSKRDAYDITVSAAFAHQDYANKQNINIEGPGTVKANYTYYTTSTREVTFEQNSSFVAWNSTSVKLTAAPLAGYEFDGWYDENGSELSENSTYSYTATSARTITAKFKSKVNKLTVSVLNYNTSYNEFREYEYEYNTVTLKDKNGTKLNNSYSSFSHTFDDEAYVTITATPETSNPVNVETDYDFVGWLMNGKELRPGDNEIYKLDSETSETLTLKKVSGTVSVSALFAPQKCYHVLLNAQMGGTYSVKYAREDLFDQEGMYYVVQSEYANIIDIYVPYRAKLAVINPQPIHGYKYDGFRVHKGTDNNDGTWTINESLPDNLPQVIPNFVRKEEQVVYLDISNKDKNPNWADKTKLVCIQRNSHDNKTTKEYITEDKKVDGFENLYKIIIPANTYDNITFAEENSPQGSQYSTTRLVIPATRYNCFKLCASQSSTGEWVDAWTTLPAQEGDFRLVYIEQTVVDKNTIHEDYRFDKAEAIKKRTDEGTDILSLHIYNKVSDGIDGMNNPEVILQRCTGRVGGVSQWETIERRMIFGPLRATDESVIRMPGRRNAASTTVVYDNGIDDIKNDDQDNGSGVWNFVISQDGNGNATILADETHRYEGNYYIRTTNADGQYNNYTYPGNLMTYSAYAAKHSDYTDYFIRYVDIYEDGTPTAEAGKHPVIKFAIANDYAIYLNHEFMIDNDRFKNDEYGIDQFVLDKGGAPNLPADANVRFGWDRVTNRLTRAYIANTQIKGNEYLVVEGTNIGSPSGDATYFTDNSNWLYSIDLPDATAGAAAKVKAKINGQYQYFMGSGAQDGYETLISGNGASTYPIRLLYDFKDDRFTTIYHPESGTINNDVELSTPLMIEREHNGKATQIVLNTNKITTVEAGQDQFTQPAYAVMTFLEEKLADAAITHHEKMFYWISFPFDVRIKDVFGLGDYGKYWIMEEYNGEQRAKSGLAQNNWKYITKKSHILKKDTGYVLCLNYSQILQDQLFKSYGGSDKTLNSGKLSLYFPSNGTLSPRDITGEQERTVTLDKYENANTAWNHHNWHIIGVPSFADPKFVDLQDDIPFVYQYWHPGDAYAAVSINDVDFQSMHAYMVQYTGNIQWTSVVNNGGSVSGGKSLAAKKDADADKKVMLRLEFQQAGSTLDKTYVQLRNDKGTKGFDMSLDLTKIINAGANIYSIVDNHEMAGNAIPKDETVLPLGVVITAAGEYTFAMPNGTEGMIVELIDYEQGTCTNLLMSDYTVTLDKGTFNQRFALRLKPDKVATSVEDITSGNNDDNVRKLLIDGMLYLQKDGTTYDAQGHAIR